MSKSDSLSSAADRATGRAAGQGYGDLGVLPGDGAHDRKSGHERLSAPVQLLRPEGGATRRRSRGPGQRGLSELAHNLRERDWTVLGLVAEHRFLTTRHIERFCFHDHASVASGARVARRVLARLERDRLLQRPFRRIGGLLAGSAASVWMLTSVGQRLLAMRAGRGAVGRVRAPGQRFVDHYLAIADTRLQLVEAERAQQLVVPEVQVEPRAWRSYLGLHGSAVQLKPDLFAITATDSTAEYEDHWFIEVDRATESIPTLLRQCRAYEQYRRSGQEDTEYGVFPRVIWIVPHDHRARRLLEAITSARELDPALFTVTVPSGLLSILREPP